VLGAVALDHGHDELLADVPREVEVDVRRRDQLAVEEAPEREAGGDRVDVREAGEEADDRPDRASPPPAGREQVARRAGPAHLERHLARQLQHLPVQEEKAGEA
jgi:hypothetical protein